MFEGLKVREGGLEFQGVGRARAREVRAWFAVSVLPVS